MAPAVSTRPKPLCGIDIASDRVRTVLAQAWESFTETRESPLLEILAVGQAESRNSVHYGEVVRQREVTQAVRHAVEALERAAGEEVGSAFVSVGSRNLRSIDSSGTVSVVEPRRRIDESDLYRAVMAAVPRDAGTAWLRPPYELLHALPQEFRVDDLEPTHDPIGSTGAKIEARVHLVSCPRATLRRLEEAVNGAGIGIERLLAAPLAAGYGVLDPPDLQEDVIVLNIGAMTTDIAVFRRGVLWHSDLMPTGGRDHGRDPVDAPSTADVHAEHARHGLTGIRDRLRRALGDLPGTVVLTGGGANLGGLSDAARLVFDGDVEIRGPRELAGRRDLPARLEFATAVGLCRYGASWRRRSRAVTP